MFEARGRVQVSPRVIEVCNQSDASDLWRSREELGQSIGSSRADVRADVFSAEPAQQIAGLAVDAGCVVVDYRSTAFRQRPRQRGVSLSSPRVYLTPL